MSYAPWWFKKLVDAETANYAAVRASEPGFGRKMLNRRADGSDPVTPMFNGDELTLTQKLEKYGIVREPGDEVSSARMAKTRVPGVTIPAVPAPVPKLGSFMRDPEADVETDDPFEFGGR